ncbi:MAG: hypothetical protein HOH43_26080 [Candidatus Latescibacteria bacterium]|nr:hypothetical protein [Candidatus Latescibacterota bacterium]
MSKEPRRISVFSRIVFGVVLLVFSAVSCGNTPELPNIAVVPLPGGGIAPDVVIDETGSIHLSYFDDGNIYYMQSGDDGQSFSDPIRINSLEGTAQAGLFRGPDIDVSSRGRIHVVWYSNAYQRKLPPYDWGVQYAWKGRNDSKFTETKNLNHVPSDNYSLAVDGERVAVVWTADSLYVQFSEDGGETFGRAESIVNADPCECCATNAYYLKQGKLHILYREKAGNVRDMHILAQNNRGTAFARTRLSETQWKIEACPMSGSSLTENRSGLSVVWETKGQILLGYADEAGKLLETGEMVVSANGKYPAVVSTPTGATLVAWKQNSTLMWNLYHAGRSTVQLSGKSENVSPHRPAGIVTSHGDILLIP